MKVLGLIPARFGSTRFPGKPLVNIQGKSMIMRVYDQSRKCNSLCDVWVATDDVRIYDHVLREGGKAIMTGNHHESGTERCAEAAENFKEIDAVVNIQGDEPFIKPEQISEVIIGLLENNSIVTLASQLDKDLDVYNPNWVKVALDHANHALYFSRAAIPFSQSKENLIPSYLKHVGIYGYKRDTLLELAKLPASPLDTHENLEQLKWLYWGYKIKVNLTSYKSPSVDTPDDLLYLPLNS